MELPHQKQQASEFANDIHRLSADHLPLYRQEQIFARDGIILSRKTMYSWVWRTADWLRIIYDELRRELLQQPFSGNGTKRSGTNGWPSA